MTPDLSAHGTCRFRSPDQRPEYPGSGLCQRFPPRVLMRSLMDGGADFETVWPWMSPTDWCGEFQPKGPTND